MGGCFLSLMGGEERVKEVEWEWELIKGFKEEK